MKSSKSKALEAKGFDGKKRWGNSAMKGHGVNSPAMMEAREKAKGGKKKIEVGDDRHPINKVWDRQTARRREERFKAGY